MQFNNIKFLKDAKIINEIDKGYSGDKYLICKRSKKYFLKIGKHKISDNIEEILLNNNISHPTIIESGKYNEEYNYIIEDYIEGKDFKEELLNLNNKYIYEFGYEIGSQYRNLRKLFPDKKIDESNYNEYFKNVQNRVNELRKITSNNKNINENNMNFINYCINYLSQNASLIKNSYLVFGHTDIKPSNFMLLNKNIIATDIENTDYKELSLSMIWSFARSDYTNDEKNFSFARGYLDGLYKFNIPNSIINCFNYTYIYNVIRHLIVFIKNKKYDRCTDYIKFVNKNYIKNNKVIISEKLKSNIIVDKISIIKNSSILLVKGSHCPENLTFKCNKGSNNYFLKIMNMSKIDYDKAVSSYKLLEKLNIPISPILESGKLNNNSYYLVSKFIELDDINKKIKNTFQEGFKYGDKIASYLTRLKGNYLKNVNIFDKHILYEDIISYIKKVYGDKQKTQYIHWKKDEVINYVQKYIKSFENEKIDLIHGDVKFENIIFNKNKLFFVDNESFVLSYDIINFMYNIHLGFIDKNDLCYRGFVNGYLKYMNNGEIPFRIQGQAKLLLIYYVLRIISNIIDNKYDKKRLDSIINSCKKYIDKDQKIEWLV